MKNYLFVLFLQLDLCNLVVSNNSFLQGDGTSSNVTTSFFNATYTSNRTSTTDFTGEYYFQNPTSFTINNIIPSMGNILDYCPGRHPITRIQRYQSACVSSDTSLCNSQYQTWSGCSIRDNLTFSTIPESFYTARTSSIDDASNFAEFDNRESATSTVLSNFYSYYDYLLFISF